MKGCVHAVGTQYQGMIKFVVPVTQENAYKTCFMHFPIKGLAFPDDSSVSKAISQSRLLAIRDNNLELHNRLRMNQSSLSKRLRGVLDNYHAHLHRNCEFVHHEKGYHDWLYLRGAKFKIRTWTTADRLLHLSELKDHMTPVEIFSKNGELLPKGKKRGVGNLGPFRTAYSAWVLTHLKHAMEEPFTYGNYVIRFVASPRSEVLDEVFQFLMNPPLGKCHYVYFSDDCCFSMGCADGVFMANGDIKQCDGSHYNPLFNIVENLLAYLPRHLGGGRNEYYQEISYAMAQLWAPAVFRNKYKLPNIKRESAMYKFNSRRLYSGSVLTTAVNNIANFCIAACLAQRAPDPSHLTKAQVPELYRLGAQDAGYLVKCIVAHKPEDLQFLKCTPAIDDSGQYRSLMCLGVHLRGFGLIDGDLPSVYGSSKVPLAERGGRYLKDVVVSRDNWGDHFLHRAFKDMTTRFTTVSDNTLREVMTTKFMGSAQVRFPIESLIKRYKCTADELLELAELISRATIGSIINHPSVSLLYEVDYG